MENRHCLFMVVEQCYALTGIRRIKKPVQRGLSLSYRGSLLVEDEIHYVGISPDGMEHAIPLRSTSQLIPRAESSCWGLAFLSSKGWKVEYANGTDREYEMDVLPQKTKKPFDWLHENMGDIMLQRVTESIFAVHALPHV